MCAFLLRRVYLRGFDVAVTFQIDLGWDRNSLLGGMRRSSQQNKKNNNTRKGTCFHPDPAQQQQQQSVVVKVSWWQFVLPVKFLMDDCCRIGIDDLTVRPSVLQASAQQLSQAVSSNHGRALKPPVYVPFQR